MGVENLLKCTGQNKGLAIYHTWKSIVQIYGLINQHLFSLHSGLVAKVLVTVK